MGAYSVKDLSPYSTSKNRRTGRKGGTASVLAAQKRKGGLLLHRPEKRKAIKTAVFLRKKGKNTAGQKKRGNRQPHVIKAKGRRILVPAGGTEIRDKVADD